MAPRRRSVVISFRQLSSGEHPPALAVPLETVADGLTQCGGPSRLVPMLAPIGRVLGVARQGSEHLRVSVSKPHVWDDQVLAVLLRQAIGHTQPQGQRTIIGNAGHAQLATARFIPTAQHEELITAGVPPVL